jgi:hypothetical protein
MSDKRLAMLEAFLKDTNQTKEEYEAECEARWGHDDNDNDNADIPTVIPFLTQPDPDNYIRLNLDNHNYYITYDILYDENDEYIGIELDKYYTNQYARLLYVNNRIVGYIENDRFYEDSTIIKKLVVFIVSQTTNVDIKLLEL